jgi:hypothetical protein
MSAHTHTYILKIETTAIPATAVHSLVLYDCDRDKLWSFADVPGYEPIAIGLEIAKLADTLVIHSDFAVKTLSAIYGVEFEDVIDTLKLAERFHGKGGNSLAAWAKRLNISRDSYRGEPQWSLLAQQHCEHDARIIAAVFQHLGTLVEDA